MLPSEPAVFNRNKDAIREKIAAEIKRWRVLSAAHTMKLDDMRRRHAEAMLERLFWFDRYLGNFDPYDVARWVQHNFPIAVLIAMAELLYGAESTKTPSSAPEIEEDADPDPDSDSDLYMWSKEEREFWNGLKVKNPPPDGTVVRNLDIHCGDIDMRCDGDLVWLKARIYCRWHSAVRRGVAIDAPHASEGTPS